MLLTLLIGHPLTFGEYIMKNFCFYTVPLCLAALCTNAAVAAVPSVESVGTAAIIKCPTSTTGAAIPAVVYHSDKIVFTILDKLTATNAADQEKLSAIPLNTSLDIKIRDNPRAVANIKSKVLTFLGASVNPQFDNAAKIKIDSVEYAAVVCPKSP
jgi:hypothetical protein